MNYSANQIEFEAMFKAEHDCIDYTVSFPYSAGIHQSHADKNEHPELHFHMHFFPVVAPFGNR